MMHVDLYTDSLYSSKIRIQDSRIAAEYSGDMSSITVGGVIYQYAQSIIFMGTLITDVSGSEIANCVTDPTGDGENTYRNYYLRGGMRIRVRARYHVESVSQWRYELSVTLYVGTTPIAGQGISTYTNVNPATHPEYYGIKFVSITKNGVTYYGFAYTDSPGSYITVTVVSSNFYDQSLSPRYDGGSSGSDPQSGYGDNDTANSATARVSNPGGIIAGAGGHGLHVYRLDAAAVGELYKFLWSTNVADSIGRSIAKPMTGIISLHRMPTIAGRSGTSTNKLNIAGWSITKDTGATWIAYEDSTNIYTIETDPIYVGTLQNDFADFAATSAAIHLPFCGTYPIDIKSIMGGYIRLVYVLDTVQGNCVCNVYTTCRNGLERLYGTYAGNSAYILPVSGSEQGAGQIAGIISTIAGAAALATTAAPLAGAAGLVGGLSAIGSGAVTQGNIGGNSAYYSHMLAELYIYRPKAVYPDWYAHQIGRPTGCAGTVGSYSGYLAGTVHADSIAAATEEERREIESTIAGGVFV